MTFLRKLGIITATSIFFLAQPAHAQATDYPNQPVRIVVPLGAGGGSDQMARLLAKELHEEWKQPVIVENKSGAQMSIGTLGVAQAAPDGYTLMFGPAPAVTVNTLVLPDLGYGLDDFEPVMITTQSPFLLLVNKSLNVKNVGELITLMKSKPGEINNAYNSHSTRLASELFKAIADVSYEEVPYRGGGQTALSTVSGETDMTFVDMGSATPLLQRSEIEVLAVTSPERAKTLPDLPTMAESGVPGYASSGYTVVLAPAKTPPAVVEKINATLTKILSRPDIVKRFAALGNETMHQSPAEAKKILVDDTKNWGQLIKDRNIKLN